MGLQFVPSGWGNFQLDIVGFLAILGEGSILANAQVSTLSKWIFVPRLLPAPQALLRTTRPSALETAPGFVTAVYSGNHRDNVQYIGHMVADAENMPKYSVKVVEITRRDTKREVKAKAFGPLTMVAALGTAFSVILLGLSIWLGDGMALLATILLSSLSTVIGIGNKWTLTGTKPPQANQYNPPGDVVIRYPKGNFLVVKCSENIARELFFAPENIDYLLQDAAIYRLNSLLGTILLMFGVIALGNASLRLQVGFAVAYMLLNVAYWIVAALPAKWHWDTASCFAVREDLVEGADVRKHRVTVETSYTRALWKVVVATKEIRWMRKNDAAPSTEAWERWLAEAQMVAQRAGVYVDPDGTRCWEVPADWDPQMRLQQIMKECFQEPFPVPQQPSPTTSSYHPVAETKSPSSMSMSMSAVSSRIRGGGGTRTPSDRSQTLRPAIVEIADVPPPPPPPPPPPSR